jgi:uncharacterized membrane protein YccC
MSSRFITNIVALVLGAIVVVSSQTFSSGTVKWIAFGISLGVLGMTALAQLDRTRGIAQRAIDAFIGLVVAWSAVAALVFDGSALTWLSFSDAIALVGLAVVGLAANELSMELAVHRSTGVEPSEPALKPAEAYSAAA